MKIINVILKDLNPEGELDWRMLPDSALLKGNNPFFVPDFPGGVEARAALGILVERLGKGISRKYARDFYGEIYPAIIFAAEKFGNELRRAGRSDSKAYAFDKAVVLGSNSGINPEEVVAVSLERMGKNSDSTESLEVVFPQGDIREITDRVIEEISFDNTIRNGDLILLSFESLAFEAVIDTRMSTRVSSDNETNCLKGVNIK